jgi:hypothetical protein
VKQISRSSGRADPFGLLVVAVALALFVTIGIQAQAAMHGDGLHLGSAVCKQPCLTVDVRQ